MVGPVVQPQWMPPTSQYRYPKASRKFRQALRYLPQDYSYLMVFHLSKNNLSYLLEWTKAVPLLGIISIPYSEQPQVKKEVSCHSKVYTVAPDKIPARILDICNANPTKKIIIIEIGGYSAMVADQLRNVVLAVEDTARGHERFLEHEDKLRYPVVSIARTPGKRLEDEVVGAAIAHSTRNILGYRGSSASLSEKNILVMGFGGIGQATAQHLKSAGAQVYIYDPSPEAMDKAKEAGYAYLSRKAAIVLADIIVGCSGHRSIQPKDFALLKDNSILISGSSRQVEFPYERLAPFLDTSFQSKVLEKFNFKGKSFFVAFNGQPINFFFDVALGETFDIPMTLLVQSVTYGLSANLKPSLYELPSEVYSRSSRH